ncbi:uncharacterized protein TNCV_2508751 [Trichonephila clavipes]|nr:uncharacterized protein TNCV_2508751 [Trichonephila clavipes]
MRTRGDRTIHHTRLVVDYTIEDAPVCDAASRVAAAVVSELRVHATANVVELFVQTIVVLQTTSILDLGLAHDEASRPIVALRQRQNQEPTDFVYDLLKLNKKLELGLSEKALVDTIFVRLEPQVQDYVEVRNPQNAIQLLEVLAKFEERYSCKATLSSRNSNNVEGRGWNQRRMSNIGNNRGN